MSQLWHRVSEGIYLVGEPSFEAAVEAGLQRAGADAVLGGAAAAWCWGLIPDQPRTILIWAPGHRTGFSVGKWRIEFRRGTRRGRATPRRSFVEETILDVASTSGEVGAVACLVAALSQFKTTGPKVLDLLGKRKRQRHRDILIALCTEESLGGIESALEYLFHRNVLLAHGLPLPAKQERRVSGRVDNVDDDYSLIVEVDGERYHDRARDHHRDNENILAHDERTLRFGWSQCNAGACTSARQLQRGLLKGGWTGKLAKAMCRCLTA